MLKPLATLLLLFVFALFTNVNAQVLSENSITPPALVTSVGAFAPGVITGSTVTVTDDLGSTCNAVTYEWQSATNSNFTENLQKKLASTKDYNPGTVLTTTYFRRVVTINCDNPKRYSKTECGGIKITIN
jgi:transcriptional accessory protein Tex/SPT6